jgi:two-component system sensor histidine kinase QseC
MRRQLVLALVGGTVLVCAAVGVALYLYIRSALVGENDLALAAKAQMAAECVHLERNHYNLDLSDDATTEFSEGRRYFQIWNSDGSVFAKSPSLRPAQSLAADMPHPRGILFSDIKLPNGNTARAVVFHFVPQPDDADDIPSTPADKARAAAGLTILAARDRAVIDQRLNHIIAALCAATAAFALGLWVMFALTVRRSLRPLSDIADQAARIDAHSLQLRLSTQNLPLELVPICRRFNDLLDRLDGAFNRERRFTADVAHELRTPIAELRTLAEVADRWPGDSTTTAVAFRDALDIARHMERMVTTLLTLGRYEAGRLAVQRANVDLAAVVSDAWRALQPDADRRHLQVNFTIPSPSPVHCDPDLVSAIVTNLLANAVQYAPDSSAIRCAAEKSSPSTIRFSISNPTDSLTQADLPHLFDPFWQKDVARARNGHSGLGLSLVKAYAGALAAKIDVALDDKGIFLVSVELPVALAEDAPQSPPAPALQNARA